jgi:3-hydroxyacyl-CoA dehydrogenase / enoyl-CoA hydratase / 3-hydroxybutyryl-CoA epimerase
MDNARVAVVGAGTMGASIAVALANCGYEVLLKDVNDAALERGMEKIDRILQSLVKRGLPMVESFKRKKLIRPLADFSQLAELEFIIEAVPEDKQVKAEVFAEIEMHCRPEAILASSTSSLSITEIASHLQHRERVIGLHFFNPAHTMKLVEVVAGLDTADETVRHAQAFAESLDKLAIRVDECASFLVNRLLNRYMIEAIWCLQETTASFDEIEKAACDLSMPVGPLTLRDMNGADIGLAVANFNYQEYGERFKPAPLLYEMVNRNWLGQKSGRGFYIYDEKTRKRVGVNEELVQVIKESSSPFVARFQPTRLFLPMINEAFFALQEHVCALQDLDPALMAGLGMRKGPLAMAEEIGLASCLEELETLVKAYGERFRPAPLLRRIVLSGKKALAMSRETGEELLLSQ